MAFVRRKGSAYYLVHNVRRRGKVKQLHLARLGETPRITDDVVRRVSRNHPLLELDHLGLRLVHDALYPVPLVLAEAELLVQHLQEHLPVAILHLEDYAGSVEVLVFPKVS